ncbi:MAG: hypothetical protein PF904_12800 [Kiritimatiellae bacterium]|jgi:hypothetical protein|nr:hypothetical protein [Kiritimatiellia bacterium]
MIVLPFAEGPIYVISSPNSNTITNDKSKLATRQDFIFNVKQRRETMKRIVECPSCHTKMQIFDIGKEINQKCPRCNNFFDIYPEDKESPEKKESETKPDEVKTTTAETKEEPKAEEKTVGKTEEKTAEKKIVVKPSSKKSVKQSAAAATKKKSIAAKKTTDAKKATDEKKPTAATKPSGIVKKPLTATKPAAPATPAPAAAHAPHPELPPAGFSSFQFTVLAALLVISIIIQIFFANKQMKQISIVNDNLKIIHSKL